LTRAFSDSSTSARVCRRRSELTRITEMSGGELNDISWYIARSDECGAWLKCVHCPLSGPVLRTVVSPISIATTSRCTPLLLPLLLQLKQRRSESCYLPYDSRKTINVSHPIKWPARVTARFPRPTLTRSVQFHQSVTASDSFQLMHVHHLRGFSSCFRFFKS
jgi:hypothetical protein